LHPLDAMNATLLTCQSEAIVDNSEPSDRVLAMATNNNKPVPAATSPYAYQGVGSLANIFALASEAGNGAGSSGTILLTVHDKTLFDGSASGRTIKPYGDTHLTEKSNYSQGKSATQPPTAPFLTGTGTGYSVYMDGIGDYMTVPDSPYLELKSQNFTMEFWMNRGKNCTSSYAGLVSKRATSGIYGAFVVALLNYELRLWMSTNGSSWQIARNTNFKILQDTWYHIAITRTGNTVRVFANGVLLSTDTLTGALVDNTARMTLGACSADGAWDFMGYMTNFRLVIGTSLYTNTFKVPTGPLTNITGTSVLALQHRTFVDDSGYHWKLIPNGGIHVTDNSPFATTIVSENHNDYDGAGASTYFDGKTTRFSVTDSEQLMIKTDASTVEFWMYPERQDGVRRIVTSTIGSITSSTLAIGYADNRFGVLGIAANTIPWLSIPVTSENYPRLNAWNHVAFVSEAGTRQYLYVNGQRVASVIAGNAYNWTSSVRHIGGYNQDTDSEYYQGHLTNMRLVLGTPVYTQDKFTVPQAPLEVYGNGTSLLAFQNDVVIDHGPNSFDITPYGTASPRHFSPFQLEDVEKKAAPKDTLITNGGVGGNGGLYGGGGGGNGGSVGKNGTSGAGLGATGKTSAVNGVANTGGGGGGGWYQGAKFVFNWLTNSSVGNRQEDAGARSGGGTGAMANIYLGTQVVVTNTQTGTHTERGLIGAGPAGGGGGTAGKDGQGGGNGGTYGGGGGGDTIGRYAGTGKGGQGLIVFTYNATGGEVKSKLLTTPGRWAWNIPNDFVSFVSVECIGGGGAGSVGQQYGAGGGGGAYSMSTSVTGLTPNRVVYYRVGRGGDNNPTNQLQALESWFNTAGPSSGAIDTVPIDATQGAFADCGRNGSGLVVGYGGQAGLCVGDIRYNGGRGGASLAIESAGGGGGAAGPSW
jgi:hypothetical protein